MDSIFCLSYVVEGAAIDHLMRMFARSPLHLVHTGC